MNKKGIKKLFSLIMCLTMIINIVSSNMSTAYAENFCTTYEYDTYKITYTITNEWQGYQNINIKLTNTGSEPILNWCLKYNPGGNIENIYNAAIYDQNTNNDYIIKNCGYNYEITPNSYIEFGYILSGNDFISPDKFELCTKRIEKKDGYEVDLIVTDEWDNGFNAEIRINNTSELPIEAWMLSFESNFIINNFWGAKNIKNEGQNYIYANEIWTNPINPHQSMTIGITASKIDDQIPELNNIILSEVVIIIEQDETSVDFSLTGYIICDNSKKALNIYWLSEYETGLFDIQTSDDGINFTSLDLVYNCNLYIYNIQDNFDKRYFKVKQTLDDGRIGETNIMTVVKTISGYEMEFVDTDNDQLPDYLEELFGLDINNPDTDGDGLSDYEEMFLTGTNPMIYDSITENLSDSDADTDGDGLSNRYELTIGTDPLLFDTDGDGLSDGEEINIYKTNPFELDTDKDGISDYDEIKMGLDPLNPNTFGIPDNEYIFNKSLDVNNSGLSEINTNNKEYALTLDIDAAGNITENFMAVESSYSETMKNDAILGKSVELIYDATCKIEQIVLKFKIDSVVVDNNIKTLSNEDAALAGISRFAVFKYFEEDNILLPIESSCDESSNTIIATVNELGNYCVIDMEKLLTNIINKTEEAPYDTNDSDETIENIENEIQSTPATIEEIEMSYSKLTSNNVYVSVNTLSMPTSNINKDFINVVFMLDTRSMFSYDDFNKTKDEIVTTAQTVFKESKYAKIYLILQDCNGYRVLTSDGNSPEFTTIKSIADELKYVYQSGSGKFNNFCVISDPVKYIFDNCDHTYGTYCFSIFDSKNVKYRSSQAIGDESITGVSDYGYNTLNKLRAANIDVSIISNKAPSQVLGYAIDLYNKTGGIYIDGTTDFSKAAIKHIYGKSNETKTVIFLGNNYDFVELDKPITYDYVKASEELSKSYNIANQEKRLQYKDYADTDNDNLYDFEEIDFKNPMISWSGNKIVLPTFKDYCEKYSIDLDRLFYGISRENKEYLYKCDILPIKSNPMKADTDNDGFVDYYEHVYKYKNDDSVYYLNPMKYNYWEARNSLARLTSIGGYSYDPKQQMLYSNRTPIQRMFGFARFIDTAANPALSSAIFCDPITFYYEGKEYYLELWKGQYGLMTGVEVGLYYRTPESYSYYFNDWEIYNVADDNNCNYIPEEYFDTKWYRSVTDEDLLTVSYTLETVDNPSDETNYTNFSWNGDHWWSTGFEWSRYTETEKELNVKISIDFKNAEMKEAFLSGGNVPEYLLSLNIDGDKTEYLKQYQKLGFESFYQNSENGNDGISRNVNLEERNTQVVLEYKNFGFNAQPQSTDDKMNIQKNNSALLDAYYKAKELSGIKFTCSICDKCGDEAGFEIINCKCKECQRNMLLYTNDPNFITLENFKKGFVQTGFFAPTGKHMQWATSQFGSQLTPGTRTSLIHNIGKNAFSWNYGVNYADSINQCVSGISSALNNLNIGVSIDILDLPGYIFLSEEHMNELIAQAEIIADKKFDGKYLYEYYDIWYKGYEASFINKRESSEDKWKAQYDYEMNHFPGLIYSTEYIIKKINELNS